MRRREFLALSVPAVAGVAGCLSGSSGAPSGTDTTTTGTTTTTGQPSTTERSPTTEQSSTTATPSVADASVSVRLDAVQPGVVTMTTPDSIGVTRDESQFLLLDVSAEGEVLPSTDDFSLRFGDATYSPVSMEQPWRVWRFYGEKNWKYDASSGKGVLLFDLPESADPPEVVLSWPGGEWRPDESARRRLVTPDPALSASVDVTDEITTSERPAIALTVQNDGDVPGRFLAGLNRSGPQVAHVPVARISFVVPAGETRTWEFTDDSIMSPAPAEEVGDGEPDMTYYLSLAGDRRRYEVQFVE